MLISQCSKNALIETRRILDQFAERKGDCVWETQITLAGLETLKKLLRTTARRNTAVACHLQRGRQSTELLWIVGNRRKFNREGTVPTNSTSRDLLRVGDEKGWHTGQALAILVRLAALFHDFGKANDLFQKKLRGKSKKTYEPYRHEWISLFLFKEFVEDAKSDQEWLERLCDIPKEGKKDFSERTDVKNNLLKGLPPIAKFIGWLIISHHRLPQDYSNETYLDEIDQGMNGKGFGAIWNSDHLKENWSSAEMKEVISFTSGTPFSSDLWCKQAGRVAKHALHHYNLINKDWFQDRFTMHLSRAILMLADHIYSSQDPNIILQDKSYGLYANTDAQRKMKQKLDEHNLGVAKIAWSIAKRLPGLLDSLPVVAATQLFKKRSQDVRFSWQNKAYDLAHSIKHESVIGGFFGVNLASTGCGKTLANARIMYALSDEHKGCRFNIALGLRVLTLQTGEALRSRLGLSEDELAVLIGSTSFQELYEMKEDTGSESIEEIIDEEWNVEWGLDLENERIGEWLKDKPKLKRLIASPILVSTIDHLISATENARGGKQIAPILRLLSSDLVLDEPDDFDVNDLPALTRLVNFAGMFGARVLISSATLPPAIIQALFEAYTSGRQAFNQIRFPYERPMGAVCAWFDEYDTSTSKHGNTETFMQAHNNFVEARIAMLEKQPAVRKGELIQVSAASTDPQDVSQSVAEAISTSIYTLHDKYHQVHPKTGKRISIGLVRMANIDPMVQVVKAFVNQAAKAGYQVHFCVYHARFPMIVRSKIEEILDRVLKRHDPEKIWKQPEIASSIDSSEDPNHIFVIFGTSVTEVGRDHDYDWAIVEPSSMRSIIQLAGRIKRHRPKAVEDANLHILRKNIKALKNQSPAYAKPGFETEKFALKNKDLSEALMPAQYCVVRSTPRLYRRADLIPNENLVDLEHAHTENVLLGSMKNGFYAARWWRQSVDWCYEIQKQSRFRKPDGKYATYIEFLKDETEEPAMHLLKEDGTLYSKESFFSRRSIECVHHKTWFKVDVKEEILRLAKKKDESLEVTSKRFAQIVLREQDTAKAISGWIQDPILGFYQE